ncbi:MAG: serpin family protein [Sandaracinaceae bacterium]|nr:serpin family protein [Sandaracinaceae bacterium]
MTRPTSPSSGLRALGLGLLTLLGCGPSASTPGTGTGGGGGTSGGTSGASVALETAVSANNRFTGELYRAIADAHRNGAASPYSIAVAFGMAREGARGPTRAELDAALHLEGDATSAFGALADRLTAIGASGVELRTANRVFLDEAQRVEPAYESALRDGFRAPFERVSFQGDPEGSRSHVNDWVAGQTNDRIEELLPPGSITADTRLVLTNAVYFHGTWLTSFDRARTQDLPFFVDGTTEARVPTMQAERSLRFGRFDGVAVGELGYTGGQIAMVVVVPAARDGLPALLGSLDAAQLEQWSSELTERPNVIVKLPRFRIAPSASLSLRAPMESLGVRLAFRDGEADLRGIADTQPPLFIADGYHKAFVEVNEEGTEAAAATGVVIAVRSAPMHPVERDELIADHPFLFFLRDTQTGAILFVGHVVDPR